MNCREWELLLSSYPNNELTPEEKAAVAKHLKTCERCSRELEYLTKMKKILSSGVAAEPQPFFETRLFNRIREKEKDILLSPEFLRGAWKTVAAVAGMVFIIATLSIVKTARQNHITPDNYLLPEIITNNVNESNFLPEKNITDKDVIFLTYYR